MSTTACFLVWRGILGVVRRGLAGKAVFGQLKEGKGIVRQGTRLRRLSLSLSLSVREA